MTSYEKGLELQTEGEEREIVMHVISLLKQKQITVDCASRILKDAQILIPLLTLL